MDDLLATARTPVALLATLAAGLQAGTYYTWASGVMPGLAKVDDRAFVATVQQVNVAIVNPVFLLSFLGAPALSALAIATAGGPARGATIAATTLAVATVVITAAGNVPLNDALAAIGTDVSDPAVLDRARAAFEGPWVRLNLARALTSAGALVCLGVAALRS